jgi:hypothetical protein
VRQDRIPVEQFLDDVRSGAITEAGGFGTAAVVSAVGSYVFDDATELRVGDGHIGPHTRKVYEAISGIQRGKRPAPEGWLFLARRLEAKARPSPKRTSRPSSERKPRPASRRKPSPGRTLASRSRT